MGWWCTYPICPDLKGSRGNKENANSMRWYRLTLTPDYSRHLLAAHNRYKRPLPAAHISAFHVLLRFFSFEWSSLDAAS